MAPKLISTNDAAQILQAQTYNFAAWGYPYHTLEQYVERETLLRQTPFSKTRLTTWVLIEPEKPLDILSACETYEYPCLMLVKGEVIEGICHAIASVFTPPHHRRKGHAATMLTSLLAQLKEKKDAIASTLYSDIGPEFYAKLGWEPHPSLSLVHQFEYSDTTGSQLIGRSSISSSESSDGASSDSGYSSSEPENCTLLNIDEVKSSIEDDASRIRTDFLKRSLLLKDEGVQATFVVLPCWESLYWLFIRAVFYANTINSKIEYSGASYQNSDNYITWTHDINESTLLVTRIHATFRQSALSLLKCAIKEAAKWKFTKLELWDPSDDLVAWAQDLPLCNFQVEHRTASLPSLVFWGKDLKGEKPNWICNETFAWV